MKTFADGTDRSDEDMGRFQDNVRGAIETREVARGDGKSPPGKYTRHFPYAIFFAMLCAVLLMDAILPLRDLWFHEAMLTQLGPWPVLPSLLLFPGWRVIPPLPQLHVTGTPDILPSWGTLAMLLATFGAVFLVYIFALRRLPALISSRFIKRSTLVLGLLFMLIPVVTSPDLYSYIAYARAGILYGLNPLTTIPRAIHSDVIYQYIFWVDQPSAYGPGWTLLTCVFQWIFAFCGLGGLILPMVLALRLWGLAMHLCSVALVWSISGSLQRLHGITSQEKRLRATLAFAWNPLLLLEACTNAHNDTTLLLILLLIIWFLVRAQFSPAPMASIAATRDRSGKQARWVNARRWPASALHVTGERGKLWQRRLFYLAPAVLLALGTCLKINLALLAPGLFYYQWLQKSEQPAGQRLKHVGSSVVVYAGLILALYAPFWQNGAIFDVFHVNPATYRSINTIPETLSHLYNGIVAAFGFPVGAPVDSPAEHFMHTLSMGLFALVYAGLCWQTMRQPGSLRTIHGLVRWMALTWLLYCVMGSPWFWPWYMVTFFGLYALFEASKPAQFYLTEEFGEPHARSFSISRLFKQFQALLLQRGVARMLTFSMLTLYCFTTWGPLHSFAPGLPGFQWSYLDGAWAWLLPLAGLALAGRFGGIERMLLKHGKSPNSHTRGKLWRYTLRVWGARSR